MDPNLLTLIVTVILFLIGQVIANIVVLAKINTRVTRVETHIIHLMQHKKTSTCGNTNSHQAMRSNHETRSER